MMVSVGFAVLVGIVFAAGFGWGQWWAERDIRKTDSRDRKARIRFSMPCDPELASIAFGLFSDMMDEAKERLERENRGEGE